MSVAGEGVRVAVPREALPRVVSTKETRPLGAAGPPPVTVALRGYWPGVPVWVRVLVEVWVAVTAREALVEVLVASPVIPEKTAL